MSTRRAEFRAAQLAILDDFRAAHPTWLRQTHSARPPTFNPPLAYVGPITEPTVTLEFGNRMSRPDLRGQLIIVEGVYENAETMQRLDEKGDALLAYIVTQHDRVSGATLLEPIGGPEDAQLDLTADGKVIPYMAVIIPIRLNAVD